MKEVRVNLRERSYNIIIGRNILTNIGKTLKKLNLGRDAVIITNKLIKQKYGLKLKASLNRENIASLFITVADTEKSKSLKVATSILETIAHYDVKKKIFILAFGGGVVGDLAGFVAAVYKRGIPYVQIPTTLLAQVDSAIGGKTGVDLREGKNLVGAFYQPKLVFSDIALLKTLSERQIRSGLSEVIKYGVIKDKALFNFIEKYYPKILKKDLGALEYIVYRCSRTKAGIISLDEYEKKQLRTILNFGHTLGHAIEASSGYKRYNHGEAIALGMLCAKDLSERLGLINNNVSKRIENIVKSIGLSVRLNRLSAKDIIKTYYHDKKFVARMNLFVLIKGIGKAVLKKDVPIRLVRSVLKTRTH